MRAVFTGAVIFALATSVAHAEWEVPYKEISFSEIVHAWLNTSYTVETYEIMHGLGEETGMDWCEEADGLDEIAQRIDTIVIEKEVMIPSRYKGIEGGTYNLGGSQIEDFRRLKNYISEDYRSADRRCRGGY